MVATEARSEAECAAKAAERRRRLPREMRVFWAAWVVVLMLTAVVCWQKYRAGTSPYNWNPLCGPVFYDLEEYPGTYTLLHTPAFFFNVPDKPLPYPMWNPVAYPPFTAALMAPMYASPSPELLYSVVAGVWLMVGLVWAVRRLLRAGYARASAIAFPLTIILFSFPMARLIQQGNIELVLWIFAATGIWAFWRGWDDAAAVLLGLAAAMKLYPIVLLGLFLPKRKWRAFAEGVATFVLATLGALKWLGPSVGVAWRGSLRNVFGYQGKRIAELTLPSLTWNHSVAELAKVAAHIANFPAEKVTLPYYAAGAAVFCFAFFRKLWKMPAANQLLALSAFMVMFPTISYFHTLVHLYAPFAVLCGLAIRAQKAGVTVPGLKSTMLLFLPLFASFPLLTFPRALLFCGLLQGIVLLALFACATEYRFEVRGS